MDSVQILVSTGAANGTFQHALMLSRACVNLGQAVTLVDVQPEGWAGEQRGSQHSGVVYRRASVSELSHASVNIVVGLWDDQTVAAANRLARPGVRLILAPTVYRDHDAPSELPSHAEALWYASWDQAACDNDHWHIANRVEVV